MSGRPLRIFHLTTDGAFVAGAEQILVGMAARADRARWQLAFCTLAARDKLHPLVEAHGWPAYDLGLPSASRVWNLPAALLRLRSRVSSFAPDVLHVHLSHASIVGAVLHSIQPVSLVQTRHYSDYVARFRPRRLVADAWAARRCDRVIAVSEAVRTQLVDVEHVEARRVDVIQNGVEWERLSALDRGAGREALHALGVPLGLLVGCAATFNERKGHRYLLDAFARVRTSRPDARLLLLGTGADEGSLRGEVARLGIGEWVHFLGHRPDAHQLMAGLDIYVQPSVEEGFGLALIEAMAMGLPVVVSAVGGMQRTVEPERSGIHVPPAAAEPLAAAILALAADPVRRAELGKEASERIRTHYSLERMMIAYDTVYRRSVDATV